MQAVIALTKLSYSEDPSELDEGEPSILETILDAMAYDTSSYAVYSCFGLSVG